MGYRGMSCHKGFGYYCRWLLVVVGLGLQCVALNGAVVGTVGFVYCIVFQFLFGVSEQVGVSLYLVLEGVFGAVAVGGGLGYKFIEKVWQRRRCPYCRKRYWVVPDWCEFCESNLEKVDVK